MCFGLDTLPVPGLQTGIFTTDIARAAAELCGDSGTVSYTGAEVSAVLDNKRLCVKLYVISLYRIVVLCTENSRFVILKRDFFILKCSFGHNKQSFCFTETYFHRYRMFCWSQKTIISLY